MPYIPPPGTYHVITVAAFGDRFRGFDGPPWSSWSGVALLVYRFGDGFGHYDLWEITTSYDRVGGEL